MFKKGQLAVYPAHGVGVIESEEEKHIGGQAQRFYILRILENDMIIMIPINNADSVGLRPVIDLHQVSRVYSILKDRGRHHRKPDLEPPLSRLHEKDQDRLRLRGGRGPARPVPAQVGQGALLRRAQDARHRAQPVGQGAFHSPPGQEKKTSKPRWRTSSTPDGPNHPQILRPGRPLGGGGFFKRHERASPSRAAPGQGSAPGRPVGRAFGPRAVPGPGAAPGQGGAGHPGGPAGPGLGQGAPRPGHHGGGARARAPGAGPPRTRSCGCFTRDADLIVVNKASGVVVHPAAGHLQGTLVAGLLHHCGDLSGIGGKLRPGIVQSPGQGHLRGPWWRPRARPPTGGWWPPSPPAGWTRPIWPWCTAARR